MLDNATPLDDTLVEPMFLFPTRNFLAATVMVGWLSACSIVSGLDDFELASNAGGHGGQAATTSGQGGFAGSGGGPPRTCGQQFYNRTVAITFDNSKRGQLVDFPVLIHLDPSRFDYAVASPDGGDLCFLDDDGQTVLSHEVDTFTTNGDSYIWVKVPNIDADSTSDSIWLYYGTAQPSTKPNPVDVWSASAISVYHLNANQLQVADSLELHPGLWNANVIGSQIQGKIGNAIGLKNGEFIDMGMVPDFDATPGQSRTLEAWFRAPAASAQDSYIMSQEENCIGHSIVLLPDARVRATFFNGVDCITYQPDATESLGTGFADNAWHHVAFVIDRPGGQMRLFVDGSFVNSSNIDNLSPAAGGKFHIGNNWNATEPFVGDIDEVRLYSRALTADWIAAQVASMNDSFASFGPTIAQ